MTSVGAGGDSVLDWEQAEAEREALLCDYVGGHPAFPEPIENGLLRRVGTGIRFQQMRSEGIQVGWHDAFAVGDATVESPLQFGRRRSMRVARTLSNLLSVLDSVLGGLPIERRTAEVVVHAVVNGQECRLRFSAARSEVRAWSSPDAV